MQNKKTPPRCLYIYIYPVFYLYFLFYKLALFVHRRKKKIPFIERSKGREKGGERGGLVKVSPICMSEGGVTELLVPLKIIGGVFFVALLVKKYVCRWIGLERRKNDGGGMANFFFRL